MKASGNARNELRRLLGDDTWVTSDHHWSHHNIRKYQGRPDDHFELMRRRWEETVGPDDVVLHLGDLVCFGNEADHPAFIEGLPGRKFLLIGNHDYASRKWYEDAGFLVLGHKPLLWETWGVGGRRRGVLFSHAPDYDFDYDWDINIHGHIHANPYWSRTPMCDYRNVSVEVTDYAPVRLGDVLVGRAGQRRLESEASSAYA